MASNRVPWQRAGGRPHRSRANTPVAQRNAAMVESFKQRRMEAVNRIMEIRARRSILADAQATAALAAAQQTAAAGVDQTTPDVPPTAVPVPDAVPTP